eukprot:403362560
MQKNRRSDNFNSLRPVSPQPRPTSYLCYNQNRLPIAFNIVRSENVKNKYTRYWIEVQTQYERWEVHHRYREFRTIYKQLCLSELADALKDIKFPKKTLFKFRDQVIKQREEALQQFMNALCNKDPVNNLRLLQSDPFCDFIKIDEDVRLLLIDQYVSTERQLENYIDKKRGGTFINPRTNHNSLIIASHQHHPTQKDQPQIQQQQNLYQQYQHQHHSISIPNQNNSHQNNSLIRASFTIAKFPNMEQTVFDFLFFLNQNNEEKQNTVKEFEDYFFKRNIEHQPLMSKACLNLVNKMLNYQQNKYADTYNKIFGRTETGLIKAMKLELHMKERNQFVTNQQVMLILDSYLKSNPHFKDIRLLLSDPEACQIFTKWQRVRKNYKDMNLVEPKNIKLSKASFRKSTKASNFSGFSDEETHQGTLNIKRIQGTMGNVEEDPLENFSDQFSQLDRESIDKRQNDQLKDVRRSMSQLNCQQWIFSHLQDNDIRIFVNEKGQNLIEFGTQIEYDSFSMENQNVDFIVQVLQSDLLEFIPAEIEDNNDDSSIFYIRLNEKPIMRVNIQIQDQLQSIFVQISEIDSKNKILSNYIVIQFCHSIQGMSSIQNPQNMEHYQMMHVVDEDAENEDEEEDKLPDIDIMTSQQHQILQNTSQNMHIHNNALLRTSTMKSGITTSDLQVVNSNDSQLIPDQTQQQSSGSGDPNSSGSSRFVNVRMVIQLNEQLDNIKQTICQNLSRLRSLQFFHDII